MKRSLYIVGICLLLFACTDKKYQTTFWNKPYQTLEEAEHRLVNYYDSLYNDVEYVGYRFNEELVDLVLNDSATLNYPFSMLQEHGHVSIATSEDGNLRCYSWDDCSGGTWVSFRNIVQFRSGDDVHAYNSSFFDLVSEDSEDAEEGLDGCHINKIYTLDADGQSSIYLVYTYNRESSNWGFSTICAVKIIGGKISPVNLFPDQEEDQTSVGTEYTIADWYFTANDGEGWDWLFEFDKESQTLYVPVAEPEITDQYTLYQFDGRHMINKGQSGGYWLHPSLSKFKRLFCLYNTDDYRIRVDEMDDGTYRYASWKVDQTMSEEPQLVIYNGNLHEDDGHSCFFENNGYTYLVDCDGIAIFNPQNKIILRQSKKFSRES